MEKIRLEKVRLSFPSIFTRAKFEGEEGKFEATFLIHKDDNKNLSKIEKLIKGAILDAKVKIPSDKRCVKDGDDTEYDGYENHFSFKATSAKRPTVINRDKTPITIDDEIIYAGCFVNAIVDVWVQNNKWGKRVNGNLYGIQFVKDGEPFGSGNSDVTDDFAEISDDSDEDDLFD